MAPPDIKDLLTCFSPSSEFYAISAGDGRIKIWDTLRGRLQTEFANLAPPSEGFLWAKPENGHLSIDYTCMRWVGSGKKKRSKPGQLLLVLGTGSGDVLALDLSAGQVKWKVSDCHPGGVTAVSSSGHYSSCIYTTGADGMICQIDSTTGDILMKFQASTRAISSLSISADGKMFATAASQLKVFNCSDNKKVQKFAGHPVGVRCIIFSNDGKFILSSGVGDRFIAFWKIDGGRTRSACCVLSMEHPAISLDCKGSDGEDAGVYVLAISEVGVCYFWHGKGIEQLKNCKPTKISASSSHSMSKKHEGLAPPIFLAKFQSIVKPSSGNVLVAYGSTIKPSFEKMEVQYGIDVAISSSQDGVLLPAFQSDSSNKDKTMQAKVTALDRANAEDATIPLPKIDDHQDKKRKQTMLHLSVDSEHEVMNSVDNMHIDRKVHFELEEEEAGLSMEDRLKSVGILCSGDLINSDNCSQFLSTANLDATVFRKTCLLVDSNRPTKKIMETLLSMFHGDAFKLLVVLVFMWKSRSASEQNILPWICRVLVEHNYSIMSQEFSKQILDSLHKMTRFKCIAAGPLLRLSGCLQLITAQIDKANKDLNQVLTTEQANDESDDQDENVDVIVYGEQNETSQSSSDDE